MDIVVYCPRKEETRFIDAAERVDGQDQDVTLRHHTGLLNTADVFKTEVCGPFDEVIEIIEV